MAQFGSARIADIAEVKGGKRLPANAYLVSTPTAHAYIRGRDIRDGKIAIDDPMYVLDEDFEKIRRYTVDSGDVCITIVGNIGDVGITPPHLHRASLTENAVKLVNLREGIDARFLMYALLAPDAQSQMKLSAAGAAQSKLGIYKVNEIKVPLPLLSVQRRIADILSAYDELVDNSQRRIKILESMARALYREWFVHFRFPGHEDFPCVASPLGEIPKGWETKPLEAVCARITDGAHHSPASVDEGFPMASVKDMHDWGIDIDSCRRIAANDYENLVRNNCKPLKNDVLIAKDGSYLKHTFVVGEEQDLVILSSIAILRPNSAIRPNLLSFTLREPTTKARMTGFVSGVAIPRIVLKDFRKFQILIPPPSVQAEWSRRVDPKVELCRKLISQIRNLRRTRDLLLPRLLSGQIEVEAA